MYLSCDSFVVDESLSINRYMLSQEGKDAARDCLLRSGLADSAHSDEGSLDLDMVKGVNLETVSPESSEDLTVQPICGRKRQNSTDIPPQTLERVNQFFLILLNLSEL